MKKIHIIEDDADLCQTYLEMLEFQGYQVEVDHSGSRAIGTLRRYFADVIILDMNLPGVSGEIVLSYIRRHPSLKHTRVILVSGDDRLMEVRGADLYLKKPVLLSRLLDAISEPIIPEG
jgi:two-component system response regulator TctD